MNPYQTFRSLSPSFHETYYRWHSSGQYEGVQEFSKLSDVTEHPPGRERDDWYSEELRIIDSFYRRLADSRVLEIGCGDGNMTWKLARACRSLTARDMDPGAVELTRQRLSDLGISNVTVENRAGEDVAPHEIAAFDVVFFVQVLEHVPGWQQGRMFDAVFSLVAPGGCLFISTPNRWKVKDSHDTNKPLIHWLPRSVKVPIARAMKWGLPGHDPAWPYPPVLHDYVSFNWMLRRTRQAWPGVVASEMTFYPSTNEWRVAKNASEQSPVKRFARNTLAALGQMIPVNLYFGDKVIFSKKVDSAH